jgi:hypothetical protein
MNTSTDELLAIKFPGIRKSWLKRVSKKLMQLMGENGGNAELTTRFKNGRDCWDDWNARYLSELSPTQD